MANPTRELGFLQRPDVYDPVNKGKNEDIGPLGIVTKEQTIPLDTAPTPQKMVDTALQHGNWWGPGWSGGRPVDNFYALK